MVTDPIYGFMGFCEYYLSSQENTFSKSRKNEAELAGFHVFFFTKIRLILGIIDFVTGGRSHHYRIVMLK